MRFRKPSTLLGSKIRMIELFSPSNSFSLSTLISAFTKSILVKTLALPTGTVPEQVKQRSVVQFLLWVPDRIPVTLSPERKLQLNKLLDYFFHRSLFLNLLR